MSALDPRPADAVLRCDAEGHLRFLYEDRSIVHLIDDSASGDIRLIALACSDTQDEAFGEEKLGADRWKPISSVEEEFMRLVLLHEPTGARAVVSSAPRACLDSVRFNAWLSSFLPAVSDVMHIATRRPS
jgi:hypothetical protein